jgi:hypothetical protein
MITDYKDRPDEPDHPDTTSAQTLVGGLEACPASSSLHHGSQKPLAPSFGDPHPWRSIDPACRSLPRCNRHLLDDQAPSFEPRAHRAGGLPLGPSSSAEGGNLKQLEEGVNDS